jgi:hypothetical protein
MYLRGDGGSSQWSSSGHAGDGFLISASAFVSALVTLPVELTGFTAKTEENTTLLKWSTATEAGTRAYVIEYSTDENNWQVIGSVQAAGNSTSNTNYNFTHSHPSEGNNYYRLKMVDLDGQFSYSKVDAVSFATTTKINFYPNPVKTGCTIITNSTTAQSITLLTLDGHMLQQNNNFVSGSSFDLSKYPNGVYLFVVRNATGRSEVLKVLKN